MIINILLFILGFVLLIFGGDWFVDGASGIARKLKISEIIIGATIVSIGTTLPEVMVSASSAATGHGEIAYGNAIGSIICNTALIAAITMTFRPGKVEKKSLILPLSFFFGAAIIYCIVSYLIGTFSRIVGILLLLIFAAYIAVVLIRELKKPKNEESKQADLPDLQKEEKKPKPLWLNIVMIVVGATMIAFGAKFLVDNGTVIAKELGVPESVIALTFVALGTSLPELITAIVSLIKGHSDLSLGNVIGANLFNIVLVSGVSITIAPFDVPSSKLLFGMNSSLVLDIPLMLFVMLIMAVPSLIKGKVARWQGILLLLLYVGFCTVQFFF